MQDYKLKVILALLSAVIFSMIFIIIALVVPVQEDTISFTKQKPKTRLEEISHSIKK